MNVGLRIGSFLPHSVATKWIDKVDSAVHCVPTSII